MTELLQFTITGLSLGVIYALIALAFVVVWKSSGVANLALGQLVLICSWFTYGMLSQAGLPPWVGLPLVVVFALLLGWVIERVVLRPLIAQPILALITVTLGLGYFLQGLVGIVWPQSLVRLPALFPTGADPHRHRRARSGIPVGGGHLAAALRPADPLFPLQQDGRGHAGHRR